MDFTSHIQTVLTVAVRLVNLLTPGESRGRAYVPPAGTVLAPAVTAALRAGASTPRDVTCPEAMAFAGIAADLRAVFVAAGQDRLDDAAAAVNALLCRTGARPMLDRHGGEPWHLHFHGADDSLVSGWTAGCATGLAVVLGSDWQHGRIGVCGAERCDRVYVDSSRNGTRRFCSPACQNRTKAAAFRARQAAS